jgi:hypothetical protein
MVTKNRLLFGTTTTFSGMNLDTMGMREGVMSTSPEKCFDEVARITSDEKEIQRLSKTSSCECIAYTKLSNDKLVEVLMNYAIHDPDEKCVYVQELGNHQLKGGRKIKIKVTVEDA